VPPQGQGLSHWIQLLEVLPYWPGFTLDELISLVKVFRLFRLEWIFLGVQSVDTVSRCTTFLSIGRASVFVMPCLFHCSCLEWLFNERGWGGAERERERESMGGEVGEGFKKPLLFPSSSHYVGH
jgi:hypothetical protein